MSALYEGVVAHRRLRPVEHRFRHRVFMAYLDVGDLPGATGPAWLWSATRPAVVRFRRADHLGDPGPALDDAVRALVARRTGRRPAGPVRVLTHLRCLGLRFDPVSLFYCFDPAERLEAVVAEVSNTPWGERHAYVVRAGDDGRVRSRFGKAFHVSPFMGMDHQYELSLDAPGRRLEVAIASRRGGELHFEANLALERRPFAPRELARLVAPTLAVLPRIYAHGLRLRLKGAPPHPHPAAR